MSTETVDISGLDKVELLRRLWSNQIEALFNVARGIVIKFDDQAAIKATTRGEIDYFCGRAIKSDLSKDEVETRLYDADAGEGAFRRIVEQMRKSAQ